MKIVFMMVLALGVLKASSINVAVAANVSYAMDELKAVYESTYPGNTLHVTLGSSGKLTAQIRNGAPYGLFLAANMKYPEALYNEKLAVTVPKVYAQGALAYLSVRGLDFKKGIALLKDEQVKKIAIANPKTAPYGMAAVEAMKKGGVYEGVQKKLVYAETISQTVIYATKAADIGFIAASSLHAPQMSQFKEGVHYSSVAPELYTPIKQGIVLLKKGENTPAYRAFYDFMLSQKAKAILNRYGYIVE